ncbi:hypothetical protein NDU88_009977 [Pleurodeles waltl]|uniref:Uncharacterized protein n=1 Tax=Pleurodeles waltl TaxID=8319 RepID=A0AAV7RZU3_PLEWA|nr:hypothetical protein NDU88_009977 [Pleurodeles waltl]
MELPSPTSTEAIGLCFSRTVVRLQGGTDKKTEEGLGFSSTVVRLQGGTDKKTEEGLGKYICIYWDSLQ